MLDDLPVKFICSNAYSWVYEKMSSKRKLFSGSLGPTGTYTYSSDSFETGTLVLFEFLSHNKEPQWYCKGDQSAYAISQQNQKYHIQEVMTDIKYRSMSYDKPW